MPIIGIFYRWFGIEPVGPNYFKQYMNNGDNICISPGGYEEASLTDKSKE
jgi:hypothetical protein